MFVGYGVTTQLYKNMCHILMAIESSKDEISAGMATLLAANTFTQGKWIDSSYVTHVWHYVTLQLQNILYVPWNIITRFCCPCFCVNLFDLFITLPVSYGAKRDYPNLRSVGHLHSQKMLYPGPGYARKRYRKWHVGNVFGHIDFQWHQTFQFCIIFPLDINKVITAFK